jgi:hypothetical protein
MTKDRDLMQWKEMVKALTPTASKQEQSPARERISAAFEEITEAKARGVTWQQFADLLNSDGIRTEAGQLLTADVVRALYHSERSSRGLRKKRRPTKPTAQPLAQPKTPVRPTQTPKPEDDTNDDEPPKPDYGFKPSSGYKTYKKDD